MKDVSLLPPTRQSSEDSRETFWKGFAVALLLSRLLPGAIRSLFRFIDRVTGFSSGYLTDEFPFHQHRNVPYHEHRTDYGEEWSESQRSAREAAKARKVPAS